MRTRGPSVWCAAGFAGHSAGGPLWAPLHGLLMSAQEEECAIIKSLWQFGRGHGSGKKDSKILCSFNNYIYRL